MADDRPRCREGCDCPHVFHDFVHMAGAPRCPQCKHEPDYENDPNYKDDGGEW